MQKDELSNYFESLRNICNYNNIYTDNLVMSISFNSKIRFYS